jgi:hypothetical protein
VKRDRKQSDHAYSISERGRARRRKADKRYAARRRARKYGLDASDVHALLARQGGVCPITGIDITGAKGALDHSHDPDLEPADAARGIINRQLNSALPNTDEGLVTFVGNLMRYAGQRVRLRVYLRCTSNQ